MKDDLYDNDLDNQLISKRFKIMTPIPNPIHLNTFAPKDLLKPEQQQKYLNDFTNQLFRTTSSKFSPTPLREPTHPKDPTKGKEVTIVKEQVNELVTYHEEGATLKSQAKKWIEHKAKKAKALEEYNHQISFRADPLPITKISYTVNSNKEATMKIIRCDNPLNIIVHPYFRLKSLGFSEWLQAKKLGLPPPPALVTFRMTAEEKKKRTEFLKEVFVTKDIKVDGMGRNLIPPSGVMPIEGLVSKEPKSGIFYMKRNTDIAFQRENVMKGLSECKASEINVRRIQVKDIVKKVEDNLKTYSSAGMDISWKARNLTSIYGGINIGLS
uniref:Uncharacterized protein n=1 Tax=Tanacetum cinerariifolium TaxID=118510 RepID=A0A699I5H1_TANCI|nr:hypothetical protein [Tanacetum cinerariifolium]